MKEEVDINTGQKWIVLDKEEIKMGFLAECVEALAERLNCNYAELFDRLEAVDISEGYILKYYEPLHTQSWENVIIELADLLSERESSKAS